MKLITTKTKEWRPKPYPCTEIWVKKVFYFLGIKFKTVKTKVK